VDITAWLRRLGLEQYEQAFRANDVDAEVLPELTADDLISIGVTSVGHRRKMLGAISALREKPAPVSEETAPITEPVPKDVLHGSTSSGAERRQLTVMFCDIVGSTALSRRLDPEDLREVLSAYHGCVTEVVARAYGFVARYMGDGVLVYFGYPQAHEDDAERALRAGLSLVDRSAESRLRQT
jgi:class 3 adenylate cyclase